MKKLRNEITYAVACACEYCQEDDGKDFKILGCLHESLREAKKDLKRYMDTHDASVFLVRETLEPMHQIPQRKAKRKAA